MELSRRTISARIVSDNAVLQHHRTPLDVEDATATTCARGIPAERAIANHQCPRRPQKLTFWGAQPQDNRDGSYS
jgi:hypothetical protein